MNDGEGLFAEHKALLNRYRCEWDYVVLTAKDERQRAYFEKRLNSSFVKKRAGATVFAALCPDDNSRKGSGCATLSAINTLTAMLPKGARLKEKKVLIIHSGGESRHLPLYAARGKAFLQFPHEADELPTSLFDEITVSLSAFTKARSGCLAVAAGDTLTVFDGAGFALPENDCAALSVLSDVNTASRHGVFSTDGNGLLRQFHHKRTADFLHESVAVDGRVFLDTGTYVFCGNAIDRLVYAANEYSRIASAGSSRLFSNFYVDFIPPMAEDEALESYLRLPCEPCDERLKTQLRNALWRALRGTTLHVQAPRGLCLQLGTVNEVLDFYRNTAGDAQLISSFVSGGCVACEGVVLESCILQECSIGAGSFLSCIDAKGLTVEKNTALHTVRLPDGFCTLHLRAEAEATDDAFCAAVFPVCRTAQESVAAALCDGGCSCNAIRFASLRECCERGDPEYGDELAAAARECRRRQAGT